MNALRFACLLTLTLAPLASPTAFAVADHEERLDRACIAALRAARFGEPAARSQCYQYTFEEKRCVIQEWRRLHNFRRVSYICLQVPGDDTDPHPWVPHRSGYCEAFPNDYWCRYRAIGIGLPQP